MPTTVTTQVELDAAIAAGADVIDIRSPEWVWLKIRDLGSSSAVLRGSSRAVLWGSSRAVLRDSSSAVLWGSSRADLWGSSSAVLRGSSSAVLRDSSSADLWDSSSAVLRGSSSAVLRGSSSADLWDSSSADLWDSSSAVLRDSSSADLWDSSSADLWDSSSADAHGATSVTARDTSTVKAGAHTAVHLWSQQVTLSGGVVIDMTALDLDDAAAWLDYHGVAVEDGKVVLYKAVDTDLAAGQEYTPTAYPIGETVTAADWSDRRSCGQGLHLGVSPAHARAYYGGKSAPRFLAVRVDVETLIPLEDKAKAPSCVVLHEVDVHGDPVAVVS